MIPVLFDKSETDFTHNGFGFLTDAISCIVTEERNGEFELTLQYPITGRLFDNITDGSVIKAKANETSEPQLFRIYQSSKPLNGIVTYQAEHISYELCCVPLNGFSVKNSTALNAMSSAFSAGYKNIGVNLSKFKAWSNIATLNSTEITEPCSLRSFLGGQQGSVLDVWGGEYEFDNFTVKLHSHRGEDKGIRIEYGKNLTDLKQDSDISECYTHIFPYAVYKQESGDKDVYVYLKERIIPIPDCANLGHIKVCNVNLSDTFSQDEEITEAKLRTEATAYAASCGLGTPKINLSVSFIQLWQTEEYKNIAPLERVSLCDTVTIHFQKLGVNAKTKVIKTVYNSLKEKYESITLGDAKSTFADTLKQQQNETEKRIDEAVKGKQSDIVLEINKAIEEATKAITGQNGGYVVLNPSQNPQELLILDKPSIEEALNVWRWNLNGLGHSSSGYNGKYSVAITADGHINGNFISANSITGNQIKAATITAEKINVEDLAALNATIGGFCIAGNNTASNGFWGNSISSVIRTNQNKVDNDNPEYAVFLRGQSVDADGTPHGAYKPTNAVFGVKERTDLSKTWDESSYTFYVRADGFVKATNADILGKITATSGKIAGFEIADENTEPSNGFWKNSLSSVTNDGNNYYAVFMRNTGIAGNVAFGVKTLTKTSKPTITDWNGADYVFAVSNKGKLTATNAEITGKITATSGSFECSDGTAKTIVSNGEVKFYTTVSKEVKQFGLIKAGIDGNVSMTNPILSIQSHATNSAGLTLSASSNSWYIMTKDGIEVNNDISARHQFYGDTLFKQKLYANSSVYTEGNFVLTSNAKYLYGSTSTGSRVHLIGISGGNNIVVGDSDAPNNLNIYTSNTINLIANVVKANTTTLATGSDRRIKNSIFSLDEKYIRFFEKLEPVRFKYNDGKSGRFHLGFIAQDVLSALEKSGLTSVDFAGYVKTDTENKSLDGYELALRYSEFPALNTYMIQICLKEIADLKAEIQSLKQKG